MISTTLKIFIASCALIVLCGQVLAAPPIWESNYGNELEDLTEEDDEQVEVSLSFDFVFEGTSYNTLYVGTNGGL